jgi:hypothetical protein
VISADENAGTARFSANLVFSLSLIELDADRSAEFLVDHPVEIDILAGGGVINYPHVDFVAMHRGPEQWESRCQ